MDVEISAQSLGFFTVSRLLFLPSLVMTILGAAAMKKRFATQGMGIVVVLTGLSTMLAWYLQKATIDQLSIVGVGPSAGLFLLLVSGLGGLLGGSMLTYAPQND